MFLTPPFFTPDFFIDTFQDTKRIVTNQVFKDPTLNKAANDYITAQTAFAKMLAHNSIDLTKYSVESISKVLFPKEKEVTTSARAKAANKPADTNTQGE
jgi:hypothetical protein